MIKSHYWLLIFLFIFFTQTAFRAMDKQDDQESPDSIIVDINDPDADINYSVSLFTIEKLLQSNELDKLKAFIQKLVNSDVNLLLDLLYKPNKNGHTILDLAIEKGDQKLIKFVREIYQRFTLVYQPMDSN
jgi:hypothetical protein